VIDSSTLKALVSTIITFAVVIMIGALTSAIGQDTVPRATAPAANPYQSVEADAATAARNHPAQPAPDAAHNIP
jgi:hypothetical protein